MRGIEGEAGAALSVAPLHPIGICIVRCGAGDSQRKTTSVVEREVELIVMHRTNVLTLDLLLFNRGVEFLKPRRESEPIEGKAIRCTI